MTRAELLTRVKRDRPGESTDAELKLWIDQLDEKWRDEMILTHEGPDLREIREVWDYDQEAWRGDDGTLTAAGVTVEREKGIIRLSGTATSALCIYINGLSMNGEQASTPSDDWDNLMPVGPGFGEERHRLHWTKTHPVSGLQIKVKVPATMPTIQGRPTPDIGTYSPVTLTGTSGSAVLPTTNDSANTSMILPMALYIPNGTVFPADFELHMLITAPELETVQPEDWLRRVLLIPELDDEVYVYWLYSKIDFRLGEMERYNNDATMFNEAWDTAAKRWHRHHMPLGRQQRHVVYGHPVPWRAWDDPLDQWWDWPRY